MCRRHAKSGEAAQRRHRSRAAENPPALEENPHPGGGDIQVEPLSFMQAYFIADCTKCCRTPIGSLLQPQVKRAGFGVQGKLTNLREGSTDT